MQEKMRDANNFFLRNTKIFVYKKTENKNKTKKKSLLVFFGVYKNHKNKNNNNNLLLFSKNHIFNVHRLSTKDRRAGGRIKYRSTLNVN